MEEGEEEGVAVWEPEEAAPHPHCCVATGAHGWGTRATSSPRPTSSPPSATYWTSMSARRCANVPFSALYPQSFGAWIRLVAGVVEGHGRTRVRPRPPTRTCDQPPPANNTWNGRPPHCLLWVSGAHAPLAVTSVLCCRGGGATRLPEQPAPSYHDEVADAPPCGHTSARSDWQAALQGLVSSLPSPSLHSPREPS